MDKFKWFYLNICSSGTVLYGTRFVLHGETDGSFYFIKRLTDDKSSWRILLELEQLQIPVWWTYTSVHCRGFARTCSVEQRRGFANAVSAQRRLWHDTLVGGDRCFLSSQGFHIGLTRPSPTNQWNQRQLCNDFCQSLSCISLRASFYGIQTWRKCGIKSYLRSIRHGGSRRAGPSFDPDTGLGSCSAPKYPISN